MAYQVFRCEVCGERRHGRREHRRDADGVQSIQTVIDHCPDHPEAAVVEWTSVHQAACQWAEAWLAGDPSRDWDQLYDLVQDGNTRMAGTFLLLQRWGGLPETRLPERESMSFNPLFERKKR